MCRAWSFVLAAVLLFASVNTIRAGGADEPSQDAIKAAVDKALPLLLKGAKGHIAQKSCFACHNQAIPMLAFAVAREHGFDVFTDDMAEQAKFIAKFLDGNRDNYQKGRGQGGAIDTAGYALFALELGAWQPDATTAAVAEYLLLTNKDRDHWKTVTQRPPSEASDFTVNYLAIRGLKKWGVLEQEDRIARRIDDARSWLRRTQARDTEDRVFRLLALHEAGVADKELKGAVHDLIRSQHKDGGWGQLEAMDSDAYATGSALFALGIADGMSADNVIYRRGLTFLVKTQLEDGSWQVKSRSKPFQVYYESGFPHGKDQFISSAATGWSVAALALGRPPSTSAILKKRIAAALVRVKPAVVRIRSLKEGDKASHGLGVIVDSRGIVVTTHHLLKEATKVEVILGDGKRLEVKDVFHEPGADLSLIRVEAAAPLPSMEFGESGKVKAGDFAMVLEQLFVLAKDEPYNVQRVVIEGKHRFASGIEVIGVGSNIGPGWTGSGPLISLDGKLLGFGPAKLHESANLAVTSDNIQALLRSADEEWTKSRKE